MTNRLITGLLFAALLAALGCSRTLTPETNTNAANTGSAPASTTATTASPQAAQNPPGGPAADSIKSIYTDLSGKGCSPERRTSEVSSERTCAGVEGYKLLVLNDDERDSITIISPDGRKHPLDFWQTISGGAFDYVGQKAEWRVASRNGKTVPVALIVRVDVQSGGSNKGGSYLAVSKITEQGICVTDKIPPTADANEKAREAADSSAGKPCLTGQ
jgi:hypothetical protein